MKIIQGKVYDISFSCRSLTYDPTDREEGSIQGFWNGDIDHHHHWGKLTIIPIDARDDTVYLFRDEIYDVEPLELLAPFVKATLAGGF